MDISLFDPKGEKEAAVAASNPALKIVLDLADESKSLEITIDELEETLRTIKARYNQIKQKEMPDAMASAGVSEFTTPGGVSIKVDDFISGSLPKDIEPRAAALKWLEENEAGGLIKTEMSLSFGKSEHNRAIDLANYLSENGYAFEQASGVHSATLQSFAREAGREGKNVPLDTLGLYSGRVAKIKIKDEKKGGKK